MRRFISGFCLAALIAAGAAVAQVGPFTGQLFGIADNLAGHQFGTGYPLPVASAPYPQGATPISASATGTTNPTTATLAASASQSTYICGLSIRANASAAATGNATVTGPVTGTMNFTQWTAPLASGIGLVEETFYPCVKSSAVNTAIAVISAAPGSGGTVSVSAWGYQM